MNNDWRKTEGVWVYEEYDGGPERFASKTVPVGEPRFVDTWPELLEHAGEIDNDLCAILAVKRDGPLIAYENCVCAIVSPFECEVTYMAVVPYEREE